MLILSIYWLETVKLLLISGTAILFPYPAALTLRHRNKPLLSTQPITTTMTDKQLKAVAMPGDFIFHSSWFEIFKSFDMATAYAIFMAMIAYMQTGAVPADEELRRLTVFLFAHIDTDRQRILSIKPKRRTTAKKKPAPEPVPEPETPDPEPKEAPDHEASPDISDTSVTSDTSATSSPTPTDIAHSEHYALRIAQATASLKAASRRSKTKRHR